MSALGDSWQRLRRSLHSEPSAGSYSRNEAKQAGIYAPLARRYGDSHKSLHWDSRATQQRRFRTFAEIADLQGRRLLDVGCGLGDFFRYLQQRQISGDFTGFDIVEELLVVAREHLPTARFELRNLLLQPTAARFDYVFSSGIYAFGDQPFFEGMVRAAFAVAEVAYIFNIYETFDSRFFTISQRHALDYCQQLRPSRIEVIDDYLPDDYTIVMYR